MNMVDMVAQFAKELRGMQVGNRTLQLKVDGLKRQLGDTHGTIRKWKVKHQVQHDIAEHTMLKVYHLLNDDPQGIGYPSWRYDYLRANGFIEEGVEMRRWEYRNGRWHYD